MTDYCQFHINSAGQYGLSRLRVPFLLFILVLCATGTSAVLCAQEKTTEETKPRLSVGLLIDTHAHQKNVIEFEREVLSSVANEFKGTGAQAFVIRFSDEIELIEDWSSVDTALRKASARIVLDAESGKDREPLLYDATKAGLLKLNSRSSLNSKALIIIAEGNDGGSATRYPEIAKLAKSSQIPCFALLVADHPLYGGRVRHFGFYLYELASASKGKAYDLGTSRKELDKAVKDMVTRMPH